MFTLTTFCIQDGSSQKRLSELGWIHRLWYWHLFGFTLLGLILVPLLIYTNAAYPDYKFPYYSNADDTHHSLALSICMNTIRFGLVFVVFGIGLSCSMLSFQAILFWSKENPPSHQEWARNFPFTIAPSKRAAFHQSMNDPSIFPLNCTQSGLLYFAVVSCSLGIIFPVMAYIALIPWIPHICCYYFLLTKINTILVHFSPIDNLSHFHDPDEHESEVLNQSDLEDDDRFLF